MSSLVREGPLELRLPEGQGVRVNMDGIAAHRGRVVVVLVKEAQLPRFAERMAHSPSVFPTHVEGDCRVRAAESRRVDGPAAAQRFAGREEAEGLILRPVAGQAH